MSITHIGAHRQFPRGIVIKSISIDFGAVMQICRLNVCMYVYILKPLLYRADRERVHFIIIVIMFLFVNNYFHNDATQL